MALTVNPTLSVNAVAVTGGAPSAPVLVLQPGTVVSAQVQSVLAADLVRIVIADLSVEVASEVPLKAGQNLQLAVSQTPDGAVRLQVVGQGTSAASTSAADATPNAPASSVVASAIPADPNDPLTPLERIAVSVASQNAASQQQSLGPLFADLNVASNSDGLPTAVQQAVVQVLAQQTGLTANLSGADIKTAFQQSGLFLESSLASESVSPSPSPSSGMPDLKAALLVLRQTLATAVETPESPSAVLPVIPAGSANETTPTTPSPTLAPIQPEEAEAGVSAPAASPVGEQAAPSNAVGVLLSEALSNASPKALGSGAALNFVQEALQEIPRAAGNAVAPTLPAQPQSGTAASPAPATNTPPPFRGSLPSAQRVASSSIPADAPSAVAIHRLLDDTDAAIARQTLLQVASLPDRPGAVANQIDPSTPRWNFEIPFATPQGTAMAQFEISRDGGNDVDPAHRVWRARFSLDVEPAGPVHALVTLSGERTSVRMWAERPETASQLRAGASELSQALARAELTPGDIVIREGAPPQPAPAKAGHFLDRAL
jgi:Flagellar hook-length control protein FliK